MMPSSKSLGQRQLRTVTRSMCSLQDALYGDGLDLSSGGGGGPTPGDFVGAGLWAVSLYYCTPLQLLLLFLGEVDTARPSDWLLNTLGRATGQPCVPAVTVLPCEKVVYQKLLFP